jgi:hypothetical protein
MHHRDDSIDNGALDRFIARVKNDEIPMRLYGHHGIVDEVTVYSKTWFSRDPQYSYVFEYLVGGFNLSVISTDNRIARSILLTNELEGLEAIDSGDHAPTIMEAWDTGFKTEPIAIGNHCQCNHCGTSLVSHFNGEEITFKSINTDSRRMEYADCPHPGGFGEYSVQIRIPSDKIVFANDFRPLMKNNDADGFSVNTDYGIRRTVEEAAKYDFLTAFVGNCSPEVLIAENGDILIANEGFDEEDNIVTNFGTSVGSICTDLWWFYAMDGNTHAEADSDIEVEATVEVEPGLFEMTIHKRTKDSDHGWAKGEKYATIKRIGD